MRGWPSLRPTHRDLTGEARHDGSVVPAERLEAPLHSQSFGARMVDRVAEDCFGAGYVALRVHKQGDVDRYAAANFLGCANGQFRRGLVCFLLVAQW